LNSSQINHLLIRKFKLYAEPALLVIDELGYLMLDQQTSNLFYRVVSTRQSRKRSNDDYTQHSLVRLRQHSAQHHHCHR